ncbi:MAG: GNAT family N-acetyltransferase [Candidatus Niyogibacteria bacterium]|nr:MAG: GNAT family N-acetyltransferase [Candidatus Niyogibacteria bacterium]
MKLMDLKPAEIRSYLEMLLKWRNDPDTRRQSRRTQVFKKGDYERELLGRVAQNGIIYLALENKKPVGVLMVDKFSEGEGLEFSWTVAPQERGKGFGKKMLALAVKDPRFAGERLVAVIKNRNYASIKMVHGLGFVKFSKKGGMSFWERNN